MFDYRHYVPVLRWKRAEWVALRNLSPQTRAGMTPLIEITPRGFEPADPDCGVNLDQKLPRHAERIAENWGNGRLFLDLSLLDPRVRTTSGEHPLVVLFNAGRLNGLSMVPVTRFSQGWEYQEAVRDVAAADGQGVCVRIRKDDLTRAGVARELNDLLEGLRVSRNEVDLVVDLGFASDSGPGAESIARRLQSIDEWRSFTVIAGALPKDLTGFSVGQHFVTRTEWKWWMAELAAQAGRRTRMPTFGDYTIQHHIFSEPQAGMNVSASIRYTTPDHWLVLRGEGLRNKNTSGYAQYPASAQLLSGQKEFCGPDYSYGDNYIYKMGSQQTSTTGSPETWLRAGINHHLTFVVRQIGQTLDLPVDEV